MTSQAVTIFFTYTFFAEGRPTGPIVHSVVHRGLYRKSAGRSARTSAEKWSHTGFRKLSDDGVLYKKVPPAVGCVLGLAFGERIPRIPFRGHLILVQVLDQCTLA